MYTNKLNALNIYSDRDERIVLRRTGKFLEMFNEVSPYSYIMIL